MLINANNLVNLEDEAELLTARDVLANAMPVALAPTANKVDEIRNIFKYNNAGIEDAARTIGNLMRDGKYEATRARCAELALKAQQVFNEIDEKQIPEIKINIIGSYVENKTLINLVLPE